MGRSGLAAQLSDVFSDTLRHYAQFRGRARPSEYWSFFAVTMSYTMVVFLLKVVAFSELPEPARDGAFWVLATPLVLIIIPALAVTSRRIQDATAYRRFEAWVETSIGSAQRTVIILRFVGLIFFLSVVYLTFRSWIFLPLSMVVIGMLSSDQVVHRRGPGGTLRTSALAAPPAFAAQESATFSNAERRVDVNQTSKSWATANQAWLVLSIIAAILLIVDGFAPSIKQALLNELQAFFPNGGG